MNKRTLTPAQAARAIDDTRALWKPVENGMTLPQFQAHRDALRQALHRVDAIKPCCHSCTHFSMDRCEKHTAEVPVEFQRQVETCADWTYDGVPF